MLSIGYNYQVPIEEIVAIVSSDSAPIKRLVHHAKDHGRLRDCTNGKKTRSAVITRTEDVYLSAFTADSLANRMESSFSMAKIVNADANWIHPTHKLKRA